MDQKFIFIRDCYISIIIWSQINHNKPTTNPLNKRLKPYKIITNNSPKKARNSVKTNKRDWKSRRSYKQKRQRKQQRRPKRQRASRRNPKKKKYSTQLPTSKTDPKWSPNSKKIQPPTPILTNSTCNSQSASSSISMPPSLKMDNGSKRMFLLQAESQISDTKARSSSFMTLSKRERGCK